MYNQVKEERQIEFMLKQRQKLIEDLKNNDLQTSLTANHSSLTSIAKHLQQYNQISPIIQTIIANSSQENKSKLNINSKFWTLNQSIEREVEDKLRQLKQMDMTIQNILNQQFDICNQIEQIEQDIRTTLSKKQPNHIQKAQPLLLRKTKYLQNLHALKQQKEKFKSNKLTTIKDLLKLLQKLKNHREARLTTTKQKKLIAQSLNLLNCLLKDIRQVTRQQQSLEENQVSLKKLSKTLDFTNERINKLQSELLNLFGEQEKILQRIQDIRQQNIQYLHFQQQLFDKIKMKPSDLSPFLEASSVYINEEQERKKQYEQLAQGIETTTETIKIFKHIQQTIENQNRRKGELLKKLQSLQKQYESQTLMEQKISDAEADLSKIQLKKQRLLKKLSSTVDQADVNAYRSIDQEIQILYGQSQNKQNIVNKMKEEMTEKAKYLFMETSLINEDFKDILSEVVPQIWFRDRDFSKQETIRDLNLYLIKTFNRLSTKQ